MREKNRETGEEERREGGREREKQREKQREKKSEGGRERECYVCVKTSKSHRIHEASASRTAMRVHTRVHKNTCLL